MSDYIYTVTTTRRIKNLKQYLFIFVQERGKCCHCLDFVCVEVLRPSQPNGVMSSAVSLPT